MNIIKCALQAGGIGIWKCWFWKCSDSEVISRSNVGWCDLTESKRATLNFPRQMTKAFSTQANMKARKDRSRVAVTTTVTNFSVDSFPAYIVLSNFITCKSSLKR